MSGFSMKVESAFQVKGRGVVLCGTVNSGILTPGEPLSFDGTETLCRGIETFGGRKNIGDKIGVLVDHRIDLPYAEERIGHLLITSDRPNEGETRFRIVINPHRPADENGHYPWQCTLCGAAVAHVDRHAAWHERIEGIKYGSSRTALEVLAMTSPPLNPPRVVGPKVCATCGQPGPGVEFCYEATDPDHCNCWQNGDPCCRCGDDSDGEDGDECPDDYWQEALP